LSGNFYNNIDVIVAISALRRVALVGD
jgi:hypothetical protein